MSIHPADRVWDEAYDWRTHHETLRHALHADGPSWGVPQDELLVADLAFYGDESCGDLCHIPVAGARTLDDLAPADTRFTTASGVNLAYANPAPTAWRLPSAPAAAHPLTETVTYPDGTIKAHTFACVNEHDQARLMAARIASHGTEVAPVSLVPGRPGERTRDSSQGDVVEGRVRLICGGPCVATGLGCGTASDYAPLVSPAAPALTRAEQLEALGWSHNGGSFASMALGLSVLCPMCTRAARASKR